MPLNYLFRQLDSLSPETIRRTLQVVCDCSLQVTFQIADDHSVLRWSSFQLVNLVIRNFKRNLSPVIECEIICDALGKAHVFKGNSCGLELGARQSAKQSR
jgi:hypothetical protein